MSQVSINEAELTAQEIYEALLETDNSVIRLQFPDEGAREQFRVRMYQVKKKTEDHLLSIGFMDESEVKMLVCKKMEHTNEIWLALTLSARPEPTKFKVLIQVPTKDS